MCRALLLRPAHLYRGAANAQDGRRRRLRVTGASDEDHRPSRHVVQLVVGELAFLWSEAPRVVERDAARARPLALALRGPRGRGLLAFTGHVGLTVVSMGCSPGELTHGEPKPGGSRPANCQQS